VSANAVIPEVAFSPDLGVADPTAHAWLRQATLRLRREVAWRWHEREAASNGAHAAQDDPVAEGLDLTRHWTAKQAFFRSDVAASYLSARLADGLSEGAAAPTGWRIRDLDLDEVAALALGLGLLARVDAAAGPIFGACLADARRTEPTLALVQRLADRPEQALSLADPGHPLWRFGLLQPAERGGQAFTWDAAYGVPPLVAIRLLDPGAGWPASLALLSSVAEASAGGSALRTGSPEGDTPGGDAPWLPVELDPVGDRLRVPAAALRVVPVDAPRGADVPGVVERVAAATGRRVVAFDADAAELAAAGGVHQLATLGWLADTDVLLEERSDQPTAPHGGTLADALRAAQAVPVTVFLRARRETLASLPREVVQPTLAAPRLTFEERAERWRVALGEQRAYVEDTILEGARRFRFEAATIAAVGAGLAARPEPITRSDLFAACRAAVSVDMNGLAQAVAPRFGPDELILPPQQRRQFDEIERAMRSLTTVHFAWGTARAWNEGGISVLFAGPSGTGKTMAAEVLSVLLDIPMFRVNLAQVVDKYIGETEKNLERIFDAADASDTILFFDEADALFGRRTEVRDAHDRYANLEVAYLLERMERFKGLAILATNRRGDLDEAFLRRLRYIVEFPVPDAAERRRIWTSVLPPGVDAGDLDVEFLGRQFQLTGGNIRSAVLNACLQAAADPDLHHRHGRPVLAMDHVLVAVKREHEKLQRAVGPTQFGHYADVVEDARHA